MNTTKTWTVASGLLVAASTVVATTWAGPTANPTELGTVRWGHDLDKALQSAMVTERPVLLLFQEIPGCQTCQDFGTGALSHPLLVEAIETEFEPVAIHNNKPGRDEEILNRYEEPSWNYPVMRFLDTQGVDLVPRRDKLWTTGQVATRLAEVLAATHRKVPGYLQIAVAETNEKPTARTTFVMHCFWDGEAKLGALDGVVGTRVGWVDGMEVVEVEYRPEAVDHETLIVQAKELDCATYVYAHTDEQLEHAVRAVGSSARRLTEPARDAKTSDRKYSLNDSPMRYLPLTPMQATKVNAGLRAGKPVMPYLSPRQLTLLATIKTELAENPDALKGLQRPDHVADLPAYTLTLTARLGKE